MTISNCCGTGAMSKLAIGLDSGTPTRLDFIEFVPTKTVKILSDGGTKSIRGTLDRIDTQVAEGLLFVQFRTKLWMTSANMAILLPCLGFGVSTNTYTIADALPTSKIILGPAGTKEHVFDGCVPTDWFVEGQKGSDPIMIDIGWIGQTWTEQSNATFFVSQSSPAMTEGYVYPFAQGANNTSSLNWLSQSIFFPRFRLHMDYHIVTEFNNAVHATNNCPTDHDLTFATSCLYSSCDGTETLLDTPLAGTIDGAALTLNFSRTISALNYQTQFVIANAKAIPRPPSIKKNDFNRLPLNFQGYAIGSTASLVVTNVNGA